jgi:hypothetical protein
VLVQRLELLHKEEDRDMPKVGRACVGHCAEHDALMLRLSMVGKGYEWRLVWRDGCHLLNPNQLQLVGGCSWPQRFMHRWQPDVKQHARR